MASSPSQEQPSQEQPSQEKQQQQQQLSFIDIGANILDEMYQGTYRGKKRHESDLDLVLQRAFDTHVSKIIITCGTLQEAKDGLEFCMNYNNSSTSSSNGDDDDDDSSSSSSNNKLLFCTVGVHPTRCSQEFGSTEQEREEYIQQLQTIVQKGSSSSSSSSSNLNTTTGTSTGHVVAIGELGLDYARTQFCDIETQKKGFIAQLQLAKRVNLPLFLHNRDTGTDLLDILREHYYNDDDGDGNGNNNSNQRAGGVVHSFDDTIELAQQFIDLGLYIGINGCSLRTPTNIEVVKQIPLNKLLLETDCPWCDIRQSHAGYEHVNSKLGPVKNEKKYERGCYVKGRYEPVHIIQVAEVVAGLKGISVEEVAIASTANAHALFGKLGN